MSMLVAGIVAGVGAMVNVGLAIKANSDANEAEFRKGEEQRLQDALAKNRQDIPNPYENIQDLSHMIQNPYANLAVATGAAEMQAEQADISLANTLDTLRASGASAGGATALAQAALRSKKGISANIEQQEAQNSRLRAQGEASMQQMRMAEKQRLQMAGVQGSLFTYGEQEKREMAELNRSQSRIDQEAMMQQANQAAMYDAIGNVGEGLTNFGTAYAGAKAGTKSGGTKNTTVDPKSGDGYNDQGGSGKLPTHYENYTKRNYNNNNNNNNEETLYGYEKYD